MWGQNKISNVNRDKRVQKWKTVDEDDIKSLKAYIFSEKEYSIIPAHWPDLYI
jgi:hypothetical protein